MAHWARVDSNNIVQEVVTLGNNIVDGNSYLQQFYFKMYGPTTWYQTSYNSRGGVHYKSSTYTVTNTADDGTVTYSTHSTPFSADGKPHFRYNYAGIGYTYDPIRDAFIAPQPYPSWYLNELTCMWVPPSAVPADQDPNWYIWDETITNWFPMSALLESDLTSLTAASGEDWVYFSSLSTLIP